MKKFILPLLLAILLTFTSCSNSLNNENGDSGDDSNKKVSEKSFKMLSFEEELATTRSNYISKVEKYFGNLEEFTIGKFNTKGKFAFEMGQKGMYTWGIDANYDTNINNEENNFAMEGNFDLGFDGSFNKNVDTSGGYYGDLAGVGAKASLKAKIGYLAETLYFGLSDLKVDIENPNNNQEVSQIELFNFDYINKKLSGKIVKYDELVASMGRSTVEQVNSIAKSKIILNNFKDLAIFAINSDFINSDGRLTEYEGKKAYKFTINEKKFKNAIIAIVKSGLDQNKVIFDINEQEIEEVIYELKEGLDETKILNSEGYLVKNGDQNEIIIKNITLVPDYDEDYYDEDYEESVDDEKIDLNMKITSENLLLGLNFYSYGDVFEFNAEFKSDKNGFTNYDIKWSSYYEEDLDDKNTVTISGKMKTGKEKDNFVSIIDAVIKYDYYDHYFGENENYTYKISVDETTKPLKSLDITEKSIVGTGKTISIDEFGELLGGFEDMMY